MSPKAYYYPFEDIVACPSNGLLACFLLNPHEWPKLFYASSKYLSNWIFTNILKYYFEFSQGDRRNLSAE